MPEKANIPSRHWSADHEDMLEQSTRDHAIDVASRRMAIDALKFHIQRRDSAFLDAGCSTGWLLDDVQSAFPDARVIGADPFLSGLRKIQARRPNPCVAQFDLCRAPFRNAAFDAIACLNVLEHIEDDVRAMGELARMLKPDGCAFVMVPAGPALFDYYDEVHHHVRRYGRDEFAGKLRAAGFTICRIEYLGILLYPAFYAVKKLGQWRMREKSMDEKRQRVLQDIGSSSDSPLARAVIAVERRLARVLPHRFGIRLCARVERMDL